MNRKREALRLHKAGMSCTQAVAGVFAPEVGLEREKVFALCGTFGGGFKCGEICGVISGAGLVIGALWPHNQENDLETKETTGEKMKQFLARFQERFPSIVCRELKELPPCFTEKEKELGLEKSCDRYIIAAVEILEEMLEEK